MFHPEEYKWKANRERLAELEQHKAQGVLISDAQLEAARRKVQLDETNRVAIEQAITSRQATADAQQQGVEARRARDAQAAQDAYKRVARLSFPGTDAEFEQAWPSIKTDWQVRQTAESTAVLAASVPAIRL